MPPFLAIITRQYNRNRQVTAFFFPRRFLSWSLLSSIRPVFTLQAIEQAVLARLVLFLAVKLGQLRLSKEENRGAPILTPEEPSSSVSNNE